MGGSLQTAGRSGRPFPYDRRLLHTFKRHVRAHFPGALRTVARAGDRLRRI